MQTIPMPSTQPHHHHAERSTASQAIRAVLGKTLGRLHRPRELAKFFIGHGRHAVVDAAAELHSQVPQVAFEDLFPEADIGNVPLANLRRKRHGWNVKLHEQIYLWAAVQGLKPKQLFEFGTFDGGSTRCFAEAAPDDAVITTIDLPVELFDKQDPEAFDGTRVGEQYKSSPAAHKIKQIRADASTYDFTSLAGTMDFIFVDAAHDYPHGLSDSRAALKLVNPSTGVIIWHDFEPYWHGLVHAILEATAGQPLCRLAGTSMGVLRMATTPA
jgi:predicted O-methyltransferase YrrM